MSKKALLAARKFIFSSNRLLSNHPFLFTSSLTENGAVSRPQQLVLVTDLQFQIQGPML
jgi:hypothetical protein